MSNTLMYRGYQLNNYYIGIPDFDTGISHNLTLNTTIARNSIDNPMFPRAGSSISLEASLTPPFSVFTDIDYSAPITGDDEERKRLAAERYNWLEYHRWMLDIKHYTQLGKNLVLNTNVHFGFFGSYKDNQINTPFERFSLGGAGLAGQNFIVAREIIGLRGYPDQAFEPRDNTGSEGGIAYNKFSAELRYLVSPNPAATIYVLGFVEGGNNFANFNKYNPFDLYKSAGVGARIFMPAFGLLGIDWGYGFDTIPGNIPGLQFRPPGPEFHFRIGQQIR
jgi:outer membrane protein insertion porin family